MLCTLGTIPKKTCYFGMNLNISFKLKWQASLSRVVCLLLSKQSGIITRTYFSSRVLVLPDKDRFSFKVFNYTMFFSKECLYPCQEQTN